MAIRLSKLYRRHIALRDSESVCQELLRDQSSGFPDRGHGMFGKFAVILGLAKTQPIRMALLFRWCHPLKIGWDIISLVAVNVIDLVGGRRLRWKKDRRDKPMDGYSSRFGMNTKTDYLIAFAIDLRSQDFTNMSPRALTRTPNSPLVTDLVPSIMHNPPVFHGQIITYCEAV